MIRAMVVFLAVFACGSALADGQEGRGQEAEKSVQMVREIAEGAARLVEEAHPVAFDHLGPSWKEWSQEKVAALLRGIRNKTTTPHPRRKFLDFVVEDGVRYIDAYERLFTSLEYASKGAVAGRIQEDLVKEWLHFLGYADDDGREAASRLIYKAHSCPKYATAESPEQRTFAAAARIGVETIRKQLPENVSTGYHVGAWMCRGSGIVGMAYEARNGKLPQELYHHVYDVGVAVGGESPKSAIEHAIRNIYNRGAYAGFGSASLGSGDLRMSSASETWAFRLADGALVIETAKDFIEDKVRGFCPLVAAESDPSLAYQRYEVCTKIEL